MYNYYIILYLKWIICIKVCEDHEKRCDESLFIIINTCDALKEKFPCRSCDTSIGDEQPAYVSTTADLKYNPGVCLVTSSPESTLCSTSHHSTLRLCPCVAI